MPFATRFAPSPTGYLHRGHAFSALTAFAAAREAGGRFILRIEDLDQGRCRLEFEAAMFEDLAWLGLTWETPVLRQSERMQHYAAALQRLIDQGLVYRCFKTRKHIMAESQNAPHGPGEAVRGSPLPASEEASALNQGRAFAWRLRLDRCRDVLAARWDDLGFEADGAWTRADPARFGDAVLARKEFPASYHLASVWDDAAQGITHVIRGADLADAPHLHVLIQALLDLPTPAYRHHPLILGADGKRLAKRDQAETLCALRAAGTAPAALRDGLGFS
ncbi:MAG: tRNA glutamyl-Q(34) synthetase GluQRS [Alphaproteobacteria bacterium]|nr:tRNA glutamyl-Q(34) synthetase GluQRS [Alphaproteobacteria bacterium]